MFFYLTIGLAAGVSVKKIDTVRFEDKSDLQIIPRSFCVTEDEFYLIPDHISGHIKVFEKAGNSSKLKLAEKFGSQGYSNTEFNKPNYCYYDVENGKFFVIDVGYGTVDSRKIIIFDRVGKIDFKPVGIVKDTGGYDIRIGSDGCDIIISGYTTHNDIPFDLYTVNIDNQKQKTFLLKSYEKYELADEAEFRRKYFEEKELPSLGIEAFIDMWGDDIYFVWPPKLRIVKINLNTKRISILGDKIKPDNFKKPYDVASAMHEAYKERKFNKYIQIKNERSFIKDIFVTKDHVFLVYEGPGKGKFRLLTYSPEGAFLGNSVIPGNFSSTFQNMWFEKSNNRLYFCVTTSGKEVPQILIYQVII